MSLNVLVVDDDFINRRLLHVLLDQNENVAQIQEAGNGAEALEKVKKDPSINLILLDIMMPVLNGIEFLKIFRSDMINAHIPVIVLSTDDTKKVTIFESGANDFLRKPIKKEELFPKMKLWS
jgi:putative two-component system response regulator